MTSQQDYLINWNTGPLGLVLRPDLGVDMPPVVAQVLPDKSIAQLSNVQVGDMLISVDGKKTTKLGYERVVRLLYRERLPMILHFRMPVRHAASEPPMSGRHNVTELINGLNNANTASQAYGTTTTKINSNRSVDAWNDTSPSPANRSNYGDERTRQGDQRSPNMPRHQQYEVVWETGNLGMSFRPYSASANVPCVDFIDERINGISHSNGIERVRVGDVLLGINGEKTKRLGLDKSLRLLAMADKPVLLRFQASMSNTSPRYRSPSPPRSGVGSDHEMSTQASDSAHSVVVPHEEEDEITTTAATTRAPTSENNHEASAPKPASNALDVRLSVVQAREIAAAAHGKSVAEWEFGGQPAWQIHEGSPLAPLLIIYAKTCLATKRPQQAPQHQQQQAVVPAETIASPSMTHYEQQQIEMKVRPETYNEPQLPSHRSSLTGHSSAPSSSSGLPSSVPRESSIIASNKQETQPKAPSSKGFIALSDYTTSGSIVTKSQSSTERSAPTEPEQEPQVRISNDFIALPTSQFQAPALLQQRHQQQQEQPKVTENESFTPMDPAVAELCRSASDLKPVLQDLTPRGVVLKCQMIAEISEILESLDMEAHMERFSHAAYGVEQQSGMDMDSTKARACFQCGRTGDLVDLTREGGHTELSCQECWELFFFRDRALTITAVADEAHPDEADEEQDEFATTGEEGAVDGHDDDDDSAYNYSFHDSLSQEWNAARLSWRAAAPAVLFDASVLRDSTASSITEHADEVWL
ncbi:TPA: hypothetical protein N0F65_008708 [Lagenidium giganteum]|uniref:PDZ domain-containing protein n=1 Tax=Lagenidium giganteum TaxID=4803 RepID=A0AAV2YRX7_9STRA|nr:TPA: hypothetical protein N0F65_008708 [Lagenidium giganteum]